MGIYLIQVEYYIHRIKQINAFQIKKAWGCFQHFLKGVDSFKFMSSSLSNIVVGTLTKEDMELANKLYKLNGVKPDQIDTLSKKKYLPVYLVRQL